MSLLLVVKIQNHNNKKQTVYDGSVTLLLSANVHIMQVSSQCLFVGWLLNVPATGECISGTDLLRQLYVLPH